MKIIQLNEWDLKQIESKGLVQSGKYVIMTMKEYRKLLSNSKGDK